MADLNAHHEIERIEKLRSVIELFFSDPDAEGRTIEDQIYSNTTTGMFEVKEISPDGCVFEEINYDFSLSPVIFPRAIMNLVEEKDVFLATLGQRKGRWELLFLSPPYEQCDWF